MHDAQTRDWPQQKTELLVVEQGGREHSRSAARGSARTPSVCLEQRADESASAFALRVRSYVANLEQRGETPAEATVLGSSRADSEVLSARALMIRAVSAAMARGGGGRMSLESHPGDRYSMAALAAAVEPMVRGSGVRIDNAESAPAVANVA